MAKKDASAQNWSLQYGHDRLQRPNRLTVRLMPAFWLADRSGKRALLIREVRAWLRAVNGARV